MSFEGWWFNSKTGQGKHVSEHWSEIKYHPEEFGLDDAQVDKITGGSKFNPGDTSMDGARGKLLIAAMKNGWVRIRGWRGQYNIQLFGNAASKLPKVMKFLKNAGVGPYTPILFSDLSSDYNQTFHEGMDDIKKALRAGSIPDTSGPAVGTEAGAMTGVKAKQGVATGLSDKQQRQVLRQRIGRQAGIPDPSPSDNKLEEKPRDLFGTLTSLLAEGASAGGSRRPG